jgi:hypothetical protein
MKKLYLSTALCGAFLLSAMPSHAMDMKDGFMVGDTKIKIGGYVDLDIHMTEFSAGTIAANSIARDMYIPGATPTAIGDDSDPRVSSEHFDFSAETSRLSFTAENGGTKGYIEVDFLGRNSNERVSNSHGLRIRRAFIKTGNVLMGQEWTTFQNLSAIPESASFLAASEGQIFVRQQMVRWTNGPLQIALENPGESRITNVNANDGILLYTVDQAERPDIVVRYNYKADFGNVSFGLLSRQIKMSSLNDDFDDVDEDAISYNIAGRVKAGAGDVRFTYATGEGMGRYIGLHAANEADMQFNDEGATDVELVESTGYVLAYRFPVGGSNGRLNVGLSSLEVDDPAELEVESVESQYVAYLWSPKPKLTYGVEYLTGTKQWESGSIDGTDEGDIDRFTFSAKFAF